MKINWEDFEQKKVVAFCKDMHFPYFHVPNETYTTSIKQKIRNREMGVSSGVPDLFIIIPLDDNGYPYEERLRPFETSHKHCVIDHFAKDDTGKVCNVVFPTRLVAVELKRKDGGTTSKNQKEWIQNLNGAGIESVVCHGADEAINWILDRIPTGMKNEYKKRQEQIY